MYVDNMRRKYRRMIMCHMIADSEEEMHNMATKIGVARKWYQGDHYDICLDKKKKAIENGAILVSMKELAALNVRRKKEGQCGPVNEAVSWFKNYLKTKKRL